MNIGFIEDTLLRGGTQIWVVEANKLFLDQGEETTILAPAGSFVVEECKKAGAQAFTYDYEKVISKNAKNKKIWTEALQACDVAVCTVHPPRDYFHCSVFAGECIKENNIDTILLSFSIPPSLADSSNFFISACGIYLVNLVVSGSDFASDKL